MRTTRTLGLGVTEARNTTKPEKDRIVQHMEQAIAGRRRTVETMCGCGAASVDRREKRVRILDRDSQRLLPFSSGRKNDAAVDPQKKRTPPPLPAAAHPRARARKAVARSKEVVEKAPIGVFRLCMPT